MMAGTEASLEMTHMPVAGVNDPWRRRQAGPGVATETTWDPARDAQIGFRASDRLMMLYGHPTVTQVSLQAIAERAWSGDPVIYLDAAHTFDPFVIGRVAKARRQQPKKVLSMIHVARAFSWHQMERLVTNCLAGALDRYQARTAVLSGLFEALAEEQAPDREIMRMSDRVVDSIRELTQKGCSVLCPCPSGAWAMGHGQRLFIGLRDIADRIVLVQQASGRLLVHEEGPPADALRPPSRKSRHST
jgi:hypothetical protein